MYGVGLLGDCIPPNTILVFPRGEVIEKSQEGKGDKPKNKGLSDKQKKLPPALQKAIMKKQSKADMGHEEQMAMIQDKISVLENHMQAVKDYMKHGK